MLLITKRGTWSTTPVQFCVITEDCDYTEYCAYLVYIVGG